MCYNVDTKVCCGSGIGFKPKMDLPRQREVMVEREAAEYWDVYTKDREKTGRLHRRGEACAVQRECPSGRGGDSADLPGCTVPLCIRDAFMRNRTGSFCRNFHCRPEDKPIG